jgi:hypothetical protein
MLFVQILRAIKGLRTQHNILMLKKVISLRELLGQDKLSVCFIYLFTTILANHQISEEDNLENLYGISIPYVNDHKHFGI